MVGPIQILVVGFERTDGFKGDIMRELNEVRSQGVIRLIDLLFVQKNPDGSIFMHQEGDMESFAEGEQGVILSRLLGLADDDDDAGNAVITTAEEVFGVSIRDVRDLANQIDPGTAAAIVLFEHTWAGNFSSALRDAGGSLLMQGILTREAVTMVGAELEAIVEAQETIELADAAAGVATLEALAAIAEAEVAVELADEIKMAAAIDVMQTLVAADIIKEAAVQEALDAVVVAGLIEEAALTEAFAVVEAAEEVEDEAIAEAAGVVALAEAVEDEAIAEAVEVVEFAEEVEDAALAEAAAAIELAEELEDDSEFDKE